MSNTPDHLANIRAEVLAGTLAPHRALDELDARWQATYRAATTPPPPMSDKPRLGPIPLTTIGNFTTPDNRRATVYKIAEPTARKPLTPEQLRQIEAEKKEMNAISQQITDRTRKGVYE